MTTREKIFREKDKYHKKMAKLSFARKLDMLIELQKTATEIKKLGDTDIRETTNPTL